MQGLELSNTAGEPGRCAQSDAATLRNSLIVSQKAEHRTIWPRNFPLATYPGEIKTRLHKRHVYKCSSSIMHDSQKVENQTSINGWMDQEKWCCGAQPSCQQARRGEGVMDDPLALVTLFHQWVGVHRERQKAVHWDKGYRLPKHSEVAESAWLRVFREERRGVRSCLGEEGGWQWGH